MVITPVQSLRVLEPLRQQMEQLFDDILRPARGFTLLPSNSNTTWAPAINIQETEAEIILKAEVPVIDAKDLHVEVSQSAVSIVGEYGHEKHAEERRLFRPEFHHGQFQRIVPLPAPIQNDQVKAEFKDGILTLTMPKVKLALSQAVKLNFAGR